MNADLSLFSYFFNAGIVVKFVMMTLILASIFSWAFIFQRTIYLNRCSKKTDEFSEKFLVSSDIEKLYYAEIARDGEASGIKAIFAAGLNEYKRFTQSEQNLDRVLGNTQRAMNAAQVRVQADFEEKLAFLAIVGSTSPYIGLFGTVWGIMEAFRSLANVQQATIAMVAPGIAEALVATALGLFAAIPAVIAYNRFMVQVTSLLNRCDAFGEELINYFTRKAGLTDA